jgi:hypothetical protein
LLEVEEFFKAHPHYANLEVVCTQLLLVDNQIQKLQEACEAIQRLKLWRHIEEEYTRDLFG